MCDRCPVPGGHTSQAAWHWVSTWMVDRRSAYRNAEREVIFSETVDWGQTCIGTGFPQFSCALVQMRYSIRENSCGHILKGGTSGGKSERKGKRGLEYVKGNSRTGGNTNKKNIYIYIILVVAFLMIFHSHHAFRSRMSI